MKTITQDRLNNFVGGRYASHNLAAVLFLHRLDDAKHVQLEVWSAPGKTKPTFEEAMKQKFRAANKGESFGPSCESGVLYFEYATLIIHLLQG